MNFEDLKKEIEKEESKKNFRNWLNKRFPNGIARYNTYHALTHPWKILSYVGWQIRYAWQRVFRGWDDKAVINTDEYLCKIIPEILQAHIDVNEGFPGVLVSEGDCDETGNLKEGIFEIRKAEWHQILRKIIRGFQAYKEIDSGLEPEFEALMAEYEEGMALFTKYLGGLWT